MSRSRPLIDPETGEKVWFDVKSGRRATDVQLELLAAAEGVDLDDLLGYISPTQKEVLDRLRVLLGQGEIPPEVLKRREKFRAERAQEPECRICLKQGDSTKHHFVNKWMLKELSRYVEDFADRRKNTIPVCIHCHRDLHDRENGSKSIHKRLDDDEKRFAEEALNTLHDEHYPLLRLIARGDDSTYETRLVRDWWQGAFST